MKQIISLLIPLSLCACVTVVDGNYIPPTSGKIAYLTVDNSKIASPARRVRIIGPTTSGCIGSPFVTTDSNATNEAKDIFRIAIPAGEKVVLQYEERIDQSNGWTDWYGDIGFTTEAGREYQFHSYVRMGHGEQIKTNQVPAPLKESAEKYADTHSGKVALVAIFTEKNNKPFWVKFENNKLPPEKSYGYCPKKS